MAEAATLKKTACLRHVLLVGGQRVPDLILVLVTDNLHLLIFGICGRSRRLCRCLRLARSHWP